MKIAFLHNESAGSKDFSTARLTDILCAEGYDPRLLSWEETEEHPELLQHGEFVAVAGGDGSIRQLALELVGSGRCLAPIPLGTANNIARSLNIRGKPEAIIAGWASGTRRRLDMGRATGPWGKQWFLEAVGVGLIARAITVLDKMDNSDPRGFETREEKLRRDLSVLVAITHDINPVTVELLANETRMAGDFLVLEILNIARAGPGVKMTADGNPDDGYFDLVMAHAEKRGELLDKLHAALISTDHNSIFSSTKVRRMTLEFRGGECRIDDSIVLRREDAGRESVRMEIEIVPGALEVLVPGGS